MSFLCNVFLIVIDALRSDTLSCYGYHRETTPAIDAFAAEGIRFDKVISQSSWTKPSVASLLTSTYPEVHGVKRLDDRLAPQKTSLPDILKKFGYITGCIQTNPFLSATSGFNQGFDFYLELFAKEPGVFKPRITEAMQAVFDWIDRFAAHPFFFYLHVLDTHNPYAPPKEFNLFGETERDQYDGEVSFMDYHIGLIRNYLTVKGLQEKTLVIITADHGEEFEEHGKKYHAKNLYEETLRVPLIMSSPAHTPSGLSIPTHVRSIDIVPTVLELLGISPLAQHQGESLLPLLDLVPTPERPALSQIGNNNPAEQKTELVSLSTGDYKLIWDASADATELYHLASDPQEKNNLACKEPEKSHELQTNIKKFLQIPEKTCLHYKAPSKKVSLDDDLIKRLRGLGYIE